MNRALLKKTPSLSETFPVKIKVNELNVFGNRWVVVRNLKSGTMCKHQSQAKCVFIELNQGQTNKVLSGADLCNAFNPKSE